ncbi:hypothetical protein NL676_027833 [Syzygium grande]|nr:hypothetical protein NL676_027833 [Syzygium grande]
MGSCFSKCRPQRHRRSFPQEPLDPSSGNTLVQDKLVISQQPPPPETPLAQPRRVSPSSPHSPSKSSCSSSATCCSSFTAGSAKPGGAVSCSSSSSSSTASSALMSSKDRSFSNDFLWSCAKENSHVLQINSLKVNSLLSLADKFPDVELGSSPAKPRLAAPARRAAPSNSAVNAAQKRSRACSPNLARQKSFRANQSDGSLPSCAHSLPRRTLRSPSPSRRFDGGEKCRGILVNTVSDDGGGGRKRLAATTKVSAPSNYVGTNSRRENVVRPPSPTNNNLNRPIRPGLAHSETLPSRQIGPKVGEIAQRVLADQDMIDSVEDLNNPLISLDCFIFL